MPIECTIDHQNKTVVSKVTGHITLEDIREYFGRVWVGRDYQGFSEIIDWTDADRVDLSVGELRSLAGAAHAFYDTASSSKLAIVASGKEGTRMAQLYRTLREVRGDQAPQIRVFPDAESARSWLGTSTPSS